MQSCIDAGVSLECCDFDGAPGGGKFDGDCKDNCADNGLNCATCEDGPNLNKAAKCAQQNKCAREDGGPPDKEKCSNRNFCKDNCQKYCQICCRGPLDSYASYDDVSDQPLCGVDSYASYDYSYDFSYSYD